MLSVTDEFKGPGLVFTMLKKCFGEDFDARGKCSQVAFTKDYKVGMKIKELFAEDSFFRVLFSIFRVNWMKNYKIIGKIAREFK